MLSLIQSLIVFFSLIIINELFNIKEIYYLILGIASSFLLYNISLLSENIIFSLIFLYLSIFVLFLSILLVLLQYVFKIELIKKSE